MKKLAGLLAFVVALAGAIALTQYYTSRTHAPRQSLPPAATPAAPSDAPVADAQANVPVTFKPQLVTLDLARDKASVKLVLEHDPARPAPEKVWVWTYFFTPETSGRYCAGDPVEVRQPFAQGNRATVSVESTVKGCPKPHTPSPTFYARVNASTESASAARLAESRISYDTTQASPVMLEGAQPKKR